MTTRPSEGGAGQVRSLRRGRRRIVTAQEKIERLGRSDDPDGVKAD